MIGFHGIPSSCYFASLFLLLLPCTIMESLAAFALRIASVYICSHGSQIPSSRPLHSREAAVSHSKLVFYCTTMATSFVCDIPACIAFFRRLGIDRVSAWLWR
ncbi:hypothetical protein BU23DRAFT_155940 [Bimuria novae-zelandiae CBS 107.79]|uniref:Secreted protein n=1 Tax=Bimuria novae-zelandiae CBS 107.79 TaxID=1447943 RepID=A0A6A5V741_9PLEO|nr:hypothetical protein BU23DRAFT_155940 [Bimuria novae-zelandiae CBS 107.79]